MTSTDTPQNYAKGLEGVIAGETQLSFVDGEGSQLYYRGIAVGELVEHSTYEEAVALLWSGKLPTAQELAQFKTNLRDNRVLPDGLTQLIREFPKRAHPMAFLRTAVSALGLCDSEAEAADEASNRRKSLRITGMIPTLIAAYLRLRNRQKPIAPKKDLSHSANFLYMMHGKEPTAEMEKALDAYLILLLDHGMNASTFSSRVTTSTQSDIYSAVTAAIGTLKGDLHGNANQKAMELIMAIGRKENAESYVQNLLDKKEKVMGFGHRIYKTQDPRAIAFNKIAKDLCESHGEKKWIEISDTVEKYIWDKKKIPCNVDFYSATVLYILGFPVDFFTTVFAASRAAGWTAQVLEQQAHNRLIRPKAVYTGPRDQHYILLEKR